MKTLRAVAVVVALMFIALPARAGDGDAVASAKLAAADWLALTDGGQYARSWDEAAALFKASVTKSDWERAVKGVRFPLGAVKSRKVRSAAFTRALPGVPDGEYVVIQYQTSFENKASAIETVTPMHEKDGAWRVSGYFIR